METRRTPRRRTIRWRLAPTVAGLTPLVIGAAARAQTFAVSIGVRETNSAAPLGENGGTAGTIEWVNLDGLTLIPDGTWQQFTFNLTTDPITAFAGLTANSILDGTYGVLEQVRVLNDTGIVAPITLWIDDITNSTTTMSPVTFGETADSVGSRLNTIHGCRPISVKIRSVPVCGMIISSPSASKNTRPVIDWVAR